MLCSPHGISPCTTGCTALSHSCFHSLTRPLELQEDICWKGFQGELAQLLFVLPLLHKSPPSLAASLSTQPAFNLLLFSHCMYICAWLRVCVWGGAWGSQLTTCVVFIRNHPTLGKGGGQDLELG